MNQAVASAKNIPKLRFFDFKDEWEGKPLGYYYKKLSTGMTPSRGRPNYFKGNIPWITSGELNYNAIYSTKENITEDAVNDTNLEVYPPNTLFIAITGLEAPGTRGKCAFNGVPATTNQSCMAFRETSQVDSKFLYYWYLNYGIRLYFRFAQGTKQQSFNNTIVGKFTFIHPKKEEQKRIAEFLTAVDEEILVLKKKAELLKRYKKGVMQKIFSQAISFRDKSGEDYPKWEEKRLEEIGNIVGGGTPDTTNPKYWNGDISWLTPTEVKNKYVDSSIRTITAEGLKKSSAKLLPVGTIIFTSRATVGDVAISRIPLVTNQGFQSIVVNENNNNIFIYYLITFNKKEFLRKSSGSTFPEISKSEMTKIKLFLPSKEEQARIVDFLDTIDNKIWLEERRLVEAKKFKKSLFQQMFV